jgi:hypothetical protein
VGGGGSNAVCIVFISGLLEAITGEQRKQACTRVGPGGWGGGGVEAQACVLFALWPTDNLRRSWLVSDQAYHVCVGCGCVCQQRSLILFSCASCAG